MQDKLSSVRMVNQAEADIAASYHAALAADPDGAADCHRRLTAEQTRHGLVFRDRYLCTVLRPRFLTEGRLHELEHVSHTLADLFERAGRLLLGSDHLLDLVGASDVEREIWAVDPGYERFTVTSRLDAFMVGNCPMFVEYNAESPASIGYCDILSATFLALPIMRSWNPPGQMTVFGAREQLYRALMRAFAEWGGTDPRVAIIDWQDVATRRDFELCAEYFESRGLSTVVTDPRAFEYRQGRLLHDDMPISLVYRRVLLHELLARREEAGALLDAYSDGAICLVNSPRSKLLHKKSLFALLSDDSLGLPLSAEERAVVESTIPWTRRLVEGTTTYRGESVDLIRLLFTHPDRFALKPADDYGGRGVVLGWDTAAERWERAVEGALGNDFVVQERVPIPEAAFPIVDEAGSLEIVSLLVDTDPLLFDGRIGGILTRISGSPLLNVSAGAGSTTPTFVVKESEA